MTEIEFSSAFSDFVNSHNRRDLNDAAKMSTNDHLSLVQHKMAFCIHFIEAVSTMQYVDMRNQASVNLAKKIMIQTDYVDRILPLI